MRASVVGEDGGMLSGGFSEGQQVRGTPGQQQTEQPVSMDEVGTGRPGLGDVGFDNDGSSSSSDQMLSTTGSDGSTDLSS